VHDVAPGFPKQGFPLQPIRTLTDTQSFGARVVVNNDVPIFVERSLYWNADDIIWAGGSNATATRLP
jgi:hypothetical protein